jgi:hypothetical protein
MRSEEAEAHASAASTGKGGRNLPGPAAGAEAGTTAGGETKPEALRLMESAVERSNMQCAYERVVKNQGAPGVDGRTVTEFKPWPGSRVRTFADNSGSGTSNPFIFWVLPRLYDFRHLRDSPSSAL